MNRGWWFVRSYLIGGWWSSFNVRRTTRPQEVSGKGGILSACLRKTVFPLWLTLLFLVAPSVSNGLEGGASFGVGVQWIGGSDWKNELSEGGMKESSASDFVYGVFLRLSLFQAWGVEFLLKPEMQVMTPRGAGSSTLKELEVSSRALHLPLSFEARRALTLGAVYGFAGPSLNLFLTEIDYRLEAGGTVTEKSLLPYYGAVPGIVAGAGYCFPIDAFNFQIEIRYTHTLHKVFKDRDATFGGFYFMLGGYAPLTPYP